MVVSYGSIVPMTVITTKSTNRPGVKERTVAPTHQLSTANAEPSDASTMTPLLSSNNSHEDRNATVVPSRSGYEQPSTQPLPNSVTNSAQDSELGIVNGDDTPLLPGQSFDQDSQPSTSSVMAGAVANLCSATLGAGVLALPFALRQAGLVVGLILLLGAAATTVASVGILIQAHAYYGYDTYESLAQAVVSVRCRHAVEASLLVFCAGCAVAYVIAVGDIAQQAGLDATGWIPGLDSRTVILLLAYITAMLPLSLLRRVQSLQCASCFSIIAILYLVVASFLHWMRLAMAYGSGDDDDDAGPNTTATMLFLPEQIFPPPEHEYKVQLLDFLWPAEGLVSILTACPIVLFAFSCQPNVCSIYHELPVPSTSHGDTSMPFDEFQKQQLMRRVTVVAVAICAALYASISLIALADFGPNVKSNMLSCYVNAGPIMQCATAAMAVAIILAFPLNIFPARVTLIGLIKHARRSRQHASLWSVQQGTTPNEGLTAALLQDDMDTPCDDTTGIQTAASVATDQRAFSDQVIHLSIHGVSEDRSRDDDVAQSDGEQEHEEFDVRLHVSTTIFLTGLTLILALILPNISVVFGLLGGTASSILGFCVPGLLGMRMALDLQQETGEWQRRLMGTSWLLLFGGVAVGILTTGVTIYTTLIQPNECTVL